VSNLFKAPTDPLVTDLIRRAGSIDMNVAIAAQNELALAVRTPLREGIMPGNILDGIFESLVVAPGAEVEFPLDLLAPGEESDHVAYTNPGNGRIPERQVEGDYVKVSTYGITSSVDMLMRYARDARWDVVGRAMQVMRAGFGKKMNDDAWHTIISAAANRNILVFDADASAGQLTKRLVSLMKTIMRRNGGGNSTSLKRGKLTDLYLSPKALEDIRNWGLDQIDEVTRREIFTAADGMITRIFGVNLHDIDELGEGQEYQAYFTSDLGGTMATGDLEILIGLDLLNNDSFLNPIKQEIEVYADPTLARSQRLGWFGFMESGYAVLDGRRVIAASI
jgi:hypothetical protein